MNIKTDIKSVTFLKAKAADLLKQINETQTESLRRYYKIPKVMKICGAIGILKLVSQGEDDVRSGKSKSQEEVF